VTQPEVEKHEKETLSSSSASSLPYWLCQPYIRAESVKYKHASCLDTFCFPVLVILYWKL